MEKEVVFQSWTSKSLKKYHPQKYYMKMICEILYYFGLGDCWYEPRNLSKTKTIFYKIWAAFCNSYGLGVFFNEMAAYFRADLTMKEKNDLILFTFAHPPIFSKLFALYLLRSRIKVFMKRFLENYRAYTLLELDEASVKKAMRYCLTFAFTIMFTLLSALIGGIRDYKTEGIPIRTEVVYYPNPSDSGIFINIFRIFLELHWWYIAGYMALIDFLCFCCLIFLEFKFKFLQIYFKDLKKKLMLNPENKSKRILHEEFKRDFVIGIQLHEDALWCASQAQYALGNIYSIQIVESIGLLVMCLIKLVSVERNLTFLFASLAFIACVVCVTGLYMMAGGEITYEASMVSMAIYHSGWELTGGSKELRTLVVVALMRSQVPVYMTAFGIIVLSYESFISVLRSSYSFFAVMY